MNDARQWEPERGLQSASPYAMFGRVNRSESSVAANRSGLKPALLVIGYGNTLRGDDGVGPRVADGVDSLHLPGVQTLTCQQLSPEYAEPVSQADTVIFVDAAVDAPNEVRMRSIEPSESSQLMAHSADPRTMLALARDVFGHAPKAWWLTIPAKRMEFGETLSREAQRGVNGAIGRILLLAKAV